jgi:hypothetical protein
MDLFGKREVTMKIKWLNTCVKSGKCVAKLNFITIRTLDKEWTLCVAL